MNRIETQLLSRIPFVLPVPASPERAPAVRGREPYLAGADAAEFSHEASALSDQAARPRFSRIAQLRDQIAADTFETPERIDGTVSRLADLLGL